MRSSLCHTTVGRNLARLLTILEIPLAHETVLAQAAFNRKVRTYWLLSGALICTATVVGILLLPIWFLVGTHFTERYLKHMSCVLTERSLKVSRSCERFSAHDVLVIPSRSSSMLCAASSPPVALSESLPESELSELPNTGVPPEHEGELTAVNQPLIRR